MFQLVLFGLSINRMWCALPLIVSVSLVYAATRYEQMSPILYHAVRMAIWIGGFMLVVFAVLWVITFGFPGVAH